MINTPKFHLTKHRFREKWYPQVRKKTPTPLKSSDMTVCIGSISSVTHPGAAFAIADRMLSSAVDSYEPKPHANAGSKIFSITPYIVSMFSNEPGFHVEIMNAMARNIWGNYSDDPDIENAESQTVEGLAHSYVDIYNKLRIQRINEQVLSKYDLTLHAFVKNQAGIENGLRRKLKKEIDAFKMPENDVIFVGLDDKYWSHIYLIQENVITCRDYEGYAVIGAGCYSADLVFNQYSYSPGFLEPEAMYITFLAKRRAEVTPTVGKMTDMHVVRGGKEFDIVSDKTIAFLDDLHKQKKETETKHWESQIRELTKRIHEEKNS